MSRHPVVADGLTRLTPSYLKDHHSQYVDILANQVLGNDPARNIALAGAYSAGKSSIIQGLKSKLPEAELVEVSLTNFGSVEGERSAVDNGSENLSLILQKEVVKRLLYSASPGNLPLSRFNRIAPFGFAQALFIAVTTVSLLLAVVLIVIGPASVAQVMVSAAIDPLLGVLLGFLSTVLLLILVQRFLHGRSLGEVSMGPASLKLSDSRGTYFDEYLDELVYFFQATRKRYVIFEDLDRFDNPGIFQSLRDLNNLLNASELISHPIVFIYAVRDSLFEHSKVPPTREAAGSNENGREQDKPEKSRARDNRFGVDSPASDRAKFFDLIVPVVPFISHDVASDLMLRELKGLPEADRPSPQLVSLAGRYFTDMRLIRSIKNEFVVFTKELLEKSEVEGLEKDHQFAMVLYKHLDLTDFERIRIGKSKLDELVAATTSITEERLKVIDRQIAALLDETEMEQRAEAFSAKAGARLLAHVDLALKVPTTRSAQLERISVRSSTKGFSRQEVSTLEFWRAYSENPEYVRVHLYGGYHYDLSPADIETILGTSRPFTRWKAQDAKTTESQLKNLRRLRRRLSVATLADRVTDESYTGPGLEDERLSMPDKARAILGDSLALDLVRAGYIDQNFALYTATYYGDLLSPAARSFILQVLDRHRSAPRFRLSERDLEHLLEHREADLLGTPSALNLAVFDYLIGSEKLSPTIDLLAAGTLDQDHIFIHDFLATSRNAGRLVARLAPKWVSVLDVVAKNERLDQKAKVELIDTALASLGQETGYVVGEPTKSLLVQHLDGMTTLRSELPEEAAKALARVLSENGLVVASLGDVPAGTRRHLVERQAFAITKGNLEAVTPAPGKAGLDTLMQLPDSVNAYLIGEAEAYIQALDEPGPSSFSVDDPDLLPEVLALVADLDSQTLDGILNRATPTAVIKDITTVPLGTWGSLARASRFAPSMPNLLAYLFEEDEDGRYDALGDYLETVDEITSIEEATDEQKTNFAQWLINWPCPSTNAKVRLVAQLDLSEPLRAAALTVNDGHLLAELVSAGHIEDSADTFNSFNHLPWSEREPAFAASARLHEFIASVKLSSHDLLALVRSHRIPNSSTAAVLQSLEAFVDRLTSDLASELARFSVGKDVELTAAQMQMLSEAGAPSAQIAKLLGRQATEFTDSEIVAILSSLEGEYQKLASAKGQHPKLPDDVDVRALLERLKDMNLVSSVRNEDDEHIRAAMRRQVD